MSNELKHPVLIIIRGIPGSGKTYFAKALQKELKIIPVIMLDPDATDYNSDEYNNHVKSQNEEGVDPKLHAYRFLRAKAYEGINNHQLIIWNQPFTNLEILRKVTDRLQEHAIENNTVLPILVVEVDIDRTVAKDRVIRRKNEGGHGPSELTFARFLNEYNTAAPLGYDVVTIDGEVSPSENIPIVLEHFMRIAG